MNRFFDVSDTCLERLWTYSCPTWTLCLVPTIECPCFLGCYNVLCKITKMCCQLVMQSLEKDLQAQVFQKILTLTHSLQATINLPSKKNYWNVKWFLFFQIYLIMKMELTCWTSTRIRASNAKITKQNPVKNVRASKIDISLLNSQGWNFA